MLKLDSGCAILKPNLYQNHNAWLRNSCVPVYREKRISILILYDPLVLPPFVEIDKNMVKDLVPKEVVGPDVKQGS